VWALENLYPNLRTQNTLGSFEYSWYPLSADEFGVKAGSHIPAKVVHAYLRCVAERFNIFERIRFRTRVLWAEKVPGGGWMLGTEAAADDNRMLSETILCQRLVVATGITSTPLQSNLPGRDQYEGTFLIYKDLALEENKDWLSDPSIRSVAVVGGSKGAHDAVYWAATAGKKVEWIVQKSGYGVAWMTPASMRLLGYRTQFEKLPTTRFFSFFSPCIWGDADGYSRVRRFLHETRIGRVLVRTMWSLIGNSLLAYSGLNDKSQAAYSLRPDFG
jgi:cation diffusion facilitator CzcD-associated flavoprotein CzcO